MVKVVVGNRKNKNGTDTPLVLYMDGLLKRELDEVKRVVTKADFDYVALVTGRVGKGKSVFSQQLAKFFDKDFDLSRICFSANEFIDVTSNCPPGSAVVLDEAFLDMNTQVSRSPAFMKVLNHLNIIRKRNLYIFILLPDFFDLHQSIALVRSEHLFYVYGEGFGGRGRFLAFGPDNKRLLYILGKKYHNINAYKSNFKGVFTNLRTVDEEMYENKKDTILYTKNKNFKKPRYREAMSIVLILHLVLKEKWTHTKIAKITKCSTWNIGLIVEKYKDIAEKLLTSSSKYELVDLVKGMDK